MKKILEEYGVTLDRVLEGIWIGILFVGMCAAGWVVASVWEFLLGI